MNDPESTRRLCAATIQCALKDAAGRKGGDRVDAIAWLASKDATRYLDLLDMPQSTLLTRSGWMDWAMEILLDFPQLTRKGSHRVINHTLMYLQGLQESQTADLTLRDNPISDKEILKWGDSLPRYEGPDMIDIDV